jgi:hypothetical protein
MVERLMFDYLLPHLFAFYEAVADEDAGDIRGQTYDDVQKIAQFILVKGLQSFTPGELTSLVKRWRFRDFRERERVLSALEHMHWIIPAPEEGGGRGRPAHSRWDVNPLVHERFSEARGRFAATMAAVTMGAGRRSKGN